MSAFIVDNKTISAIAKAFVEYGVDYRADDYKQKVRIIIDVNEMAQEIGQSLLNQNYKSVNYRYSDDAETPEFKYEKVKIDFGIVYGCIQCYEYQASETEDYFDSRLHFSLMRLQKKILERLLRMNGMAAPYGYDGHNILEY